MPDGVAGDATLTAPDGSTIVLKWEAAKTAPLTGSVEQDGAPNDPLTGSADYDDTTTASPSPLHGGAQTGGHQPKGPDLVSSNPKYDPGYWNRPDIKGSTNCYAYAANDPDGHPAGKPQPGEHSGHPMTEVNCASVGLAAVSDGMIPGNDPPNPPPGYYAVALVMDPGVDYHWYRQDKFGLWSHKPGNGEATDVDASDLPLLITDPKAVNRNYAWKSASGYWALGGGSVGPNYYIFCGYFYVPAGGIRTGLP